MMLIKQCLYCQFQKLKKVHGPKRLSVFFDIVKLINVYVYIIVIASVE